MIKFYIQMHNNYYNVVLYYQPDLLRVIGKLY